MANNLVYIWAKELIRQFTKETLESFINTEKNHNLSCNADYNHNEIPFYSISLTKHQM